MVNEIWNKETHVDDAKTAYANSMIFPIGEPNDAFAKYFVGQSYLVPIQNNKCLLPL